MRERQKGAVVILAKLLDGKEEELLTCWLADRVHEILENEAVATQVLEMVSKDFKTKKQRVPATKAK